MEFSKEPTKREIKITSSMKKDMKLMVKRGYKIENFTTVVTLLANDLPIPEHYKDHELIGNLVGHRELHIQNDWLLIYKKMDNILVLELTRTGTHSDLFNK